LNPTMKDVIIGKLIHEMIGEGAKQRLSARRLEMISGNVASYSRMLNSPEQLEAVKDANNLTAIIAALNAEQEAEKKRKLDEKKLAAAEKMAKRAIEAANLAEERCMRKG